MMLTGKDIHEAYMVAGSQDSAPDSKWEQVNSTARGYYERMATHLNEQVQTSAQGPLSGKIIHEAVAASIDEYPWEEVEEDIQQALDAAATKLNALYIQPLQGLVREYQYLFEHEDDSYAYDNDVRHAWQKRKTDADTCAKFLLGEE